MVVCDVRAIFHGREECDGKGTHETSEYIFSLQHKNYLSSIYQSVSRILGKIKNFPPSKTKCGKKNFSFFLVESH